jgi:hypothetical protein
MASDPERVCTSKILWSRVREAIVATLEQMTLADLIPAGIPVNAGTPANAGSRANRGASANPGAPADAGTRTTRSTPTSAGDPTTRTPHPNTTTPKKAVAA